MNPNLFSPFPGPSPRGDAPSAEKQLPLSQVVERSRSFSSDPRITGSGLGNTGSKNAVEMHSSNVYGGHGGSSADLLDAPAKCPFSELAAEGAGDVTITAKRDLRGLFRKRSKKGQNTGPVMHKLKDSSRAAKTRRKNRCGDAADIDNAADISDETVLNQLSVASWRMLFVRQLRVLLAKNLLVLIRHPILLAFLVLLPPISVLFIAGPAYPSKRLTKWYAPIEIGPFNMTKQIAYYPNNTDTMRLFVQYLKEYFDPPLLDDQVIGFEDEAACALNVSADPARYHASFTFALNNTKIDSLSLHYVWRVSDYFKKLYADPTDPEYFDPFRAQHIAEHVITRYLIENIFVSKMEGYMSNDLKYVATAIKTGNIKYDNRVSLQWFPDILYYVEDDFTNKISTVAPPVVSAAAVVLLYTFMYQLVAEKETKLRQSLHTIGMLDSAYWLSNVIIGVALSAILSFLVITTGLLTRSTYWLNSPWLVNFVIFWLLYFGVVSFAFLLASLFHHTQAVGFTAFLMVIVFAGVGLLTGNHKIMYPENGKFSPFWLFFPTHAFQAMFMMSLKTIPIALNNMPSVSLKFTWKDTVNFTGNCVAARIASVATDKVVADTGSFYCSSSAYNCGHTVLFMMLMQLAVCAAQCFVAAYLDFILPAAHGARMKLWTPLTLNFWGLIRTPPPPDSHKPGYRPPKPLEEWDKDVLRQYKYVLSAPGTNEYKRVRRSSILIYDLNVTYSKFCDIKWLPAKRAVRNLSLSIPRNTIYGLLGPNGAGKSTTLSVLTGTLKPTSGYVAIEGYSITHQRQKVCQLIGYAPQFDILWPDLTPAEHIKFFCSMRGVDYAKDLEELRVTREMVVKAGLVSSLERGSPTALETKRKRVQRWKPGERELVFERLTDVSLQESANFPTRSLSGGMKRRLTIALACIGDPRVIFMDEPTSGLDPISRRKVWDAIQKYKIGRVIILTSHCMEEVDVLSDTIGIIASGVLRCSSSSSRLKKRYGTGYRLDIDVNEGAILRVRDELVNRYYPKSVLIGKAGGHLTLAVPKGDDSQALCTFLQQVEAASFVREWSIRQTTLEEVFLAIARSSKFMDVLSKSTKGGLKRTHLINHNPHNL